MQIILILKTKICGSVFLVLVLVLLNHFDIKIWYSNKYQQKVLQKRKEVFFLQSRVSYIFLKSTSSKTKQLIQQQQKVNSWINHHSVDKCSTALPYNYLSSHRWGFFLFILHRSLFMYFFFQEKWNDFKSSCNRWN